MHELSIVEGIIRIIEARKKEHGFSRVTRVEIVCGRFSCLTEESLRFCFEAATKSSFLEGAALEIVRLPEKFRCMGCGAEFGAGNMKGEACPSCRSGDVAPAVDQGVYISKIEVE